MTTVGAAYKMLFQSTHPRRMWLVQLSSLCAALRFNPHTHEGCDRWVHVLNPGERSFNPHTHEGCDAAYFKALGWTVVSIHTPTKDVTPISLLHTQLVQFQSTHPRRMWLLFLASLTHSMEFQSTHPRRMWLPNGGTKQIGISFQSTHPRRMWQLSLLLLLPSKKFQSTHPRRMWLTISFFMVQR